MARASRALEGGCARSRKLLELLVTRPAFDDPRTWIATRRVSLDQSATTFRRSATDRVERERTALDHARDRLRLLGPAATLDRGYAVVQSEDGAVISDASAVAVQTSVGVRLARGSLAATVTEVRP